MTPASELVKLDRVNKGNMTRVLTLALVSLLFLRQNVSMAQGEKPADYLTSDFHRAKREELRRLMPPNSVAVFFANAERNRSNDGFYKYHQDPNFYYLTGHREPHAVLFIFKEPQAIDDTQTDADSFADPVTKKPTIESALEKRRQKREQSHDD